jgi:predicted phage tail protein
MRKILMIALGVSLIAASSVQVAAAGERHHSRKIVRAPTSEQWQQFRGARNSVEWPNGNSVSRLYNEGNS